MTIFVTGGAGFIGSNFVRMMLQKHRSYKIVNFDKLTYAGNLDNLKDIEKNPNYKFIKGDITSAKDVEKGMKGCGLVVNFAAESHVDRSISDPSAFVKTNFYGVYNLIEIAKKQNIKKFLHISTDEVYGSTKGRPFKETDTIKPSSPYSASKASADLLALSYYNTFKFPLVITRSSNNYGPYQYPEKLIPLFITNLMENKQIPVYGTGKNVRDWIYVEDNCSGLDLVLHKGKLGEVYNIGGGNEKTNLYITNMILKYTGKPDSLIRHVADRLGHDFRYALDTSKARKLGYRPKYSFDEALKKTVEWYIFNPEWWKKLKK